MLKRIICALLASVMITAALASCANGSESGDESGTRPQTDTNNEENTLEVLDIPDTRYNNTELCFLTRDEGSWSTVEIFADSNTTSSDNISYAVFERNDRILQKYGVSIKEYAVSDSYTAVTNEVAAPSGDFLAIVSNVSSATSFATSNYIWDLNSDQFDYIDLNKSWWDTDMAKNLSVNEMLFFATGDLMTLDNDATFAIMFNKSLATDSQLPNLYELVDNGQWTMDKLLDFEQRSVQDKNGDGSLSYDSDICGFAYTQDVAPCLLIAGGITLCQKDEEDIPFYELNIERTQDIADICKQIFSAEYTINMNEVSVGVEEAGKKCFGENHALFFGECLQCVTRVRGYDVDFGILPFPKFNQQQDGYHSLMHATASMVSIPKSVTNDDLLMVECMLEAMACYSVDTLTKQYYEINLKTKGAKDVESGPMIDMILENRACDLAYYYNLGSNNAFANIASCLLPTNNSSVASENTRALKSVKNGITSLLKKLEKYNAAT
ncbi:MAG: hypothetical protein E7610_02510 [Ruminococcaceae bacterium]|nr:hypothetical protein [Oscillospiraceae bacterium]